ncbi:MAG: hypothetical protein PUB19_10290 [Lachnospiraceae bacterium]|nr:hypothetical protein [Lachnospiraceae bacterium]
MGTYCRAEMKFIDVLALSDATVTTDDNQGIGYVELFSDETKQKDYGTLELNQFVLDGSKSILPVVPTDIAFWNNALSMDDCTFEVNPKITISFSGQHSSSGLTLYFEDEYPEEIKVSWYTLYGSELITETYYPDNLVYECRNQVHNYGKIVIEFVRTSFPKRYVKLQYVLYGKYIVWDKDMVQSATVQEDIDVTSATIPINEAYISIVDERNDFDAGNESGAWKSVQKTQEVTLSEFNNGEIIPMGTYFVNDFSFSRNIAKFSLVDVVGLLDKYTFYEGEIYTNVKASEILKAIFHAAGVRKYVIDDVVGDILLSGHLAIQTCREALQKVCFACGAVAHSCRSDTLRIYKPDRYVKSTVGTNRKFNGGTIITLDEYVSGVSIECKKYSLDKEESEILNEKLAAGETKIMFSEPYLPESIVASKGTLKEIKANYLVIYMEMAGECVITGKKYSNTTFSIQRNIDFLEAGETENVKSFNGCTIYRSEKLLDIAEHILNYYGLRKKVDMRYLPNAEQVGEWVNINQIGGTTSTTLMESQSVDLTGGCIATASCRGYSIVVTEDVFTGEELFAGGDVLI